MACADRHKLLPNVKGFGEIRAARMASARYSEPRSSCSMARDFHEHSSTDVLRSFSLRERALLDLPLLSLSLSAAAWFRSSFEPRSPPASPIFDYRACSSPRAFLRGNEGTRAASRKSRLTSRTLIYEAPDSPWNAHLRYNVGSTAIRDREDTLVNPFELTPVDGTLGATARISEKSINFQLC